MAESIFNTIKKMLSIPVGDTAFDTDLIVHINSVFMVLNQLGIGPEDVFSLTDQTTEWGDFLTEPTAQSAVKSYIYLRLRLIFDPPGTSYHISAIEKQIQELEWRLAASVPIPEEVIIP